MKLKRSLAHRGLLALAITLAFEITCVFIFYGLLGEADRRLGQEEHLQTVISHLNRQSNLIQRLTIEFIRFVVTQRPETTPQQIQIHNQIENEFATLKELLADDPKERTAVENIEKTLTYGQSLMEACRKAWFDENRPLHLALAARMHTVSDRCTYMSDQILEDFNRQKEEAHNRRVKERANLQSFLVVFFVLNLLVFGLAFWAARRVTGRLAVIADNSLRLSAGKELHEPLKGEDELARVDNTFHEMADELEIARQKERAVIENARDVICSIDADERFTAVSAAALASWGYEADDLIGSRYMNLVIAEDREKTQAALDQIIKEKANTEIENRILKKDGTVRYVSWSATWSAKEKSLFCVAHDVTERREIEIKKQEFVAMVSHDLRTPLAAIRGTLSLIEENVIDTNSDPGRKRVQAAQDSTERLINLVNDLLDIEKLEAGNLQLDLQCIDLNYILSSSVDAVRVNAEAAKVTLNTQPTDLQVIADRDRCIQVLINLLSNAIKFSPADSSIDVSAAQKGDFAEVRVRDHGCGIPAQFRDSIFERFKQVNVSDGKRGKGTGLGLAICKAIIESHGGRIAVESEEGKGSTFWFQIPLG